MGIESAKLEHERAEARRDLDDTLAAMADKAAETRAELYPPALTAGIVIAASAGFLIGLRRERALDPLAYAAAGYCGWKIVRKFWNRSDTTA